MDKVNPLFMGKLPALPSVANIKNVRGRPKHKEIIRFTSQPKSIVSQTLSKLKSEKSEVLTVEDGKDCSTYSPINEDGQNDGSYQSINKVKHDKTHVQGKSYFFCEYKDCSYSSKLSCNLLKHKRTHTNDKPYLCDKCSFRSNYVNSLKSHKRIHSQEKPYPCKHCSYKCNSSSNLKKHCLHRHPEVIKGI